MSVFTPDVIFENITFVTPEYLSERGIKGLILDVDNTLTHHGSQFIDEKTKAWLELMKEKRVKLIIVSNNNFERVEPFAKMLELPFVSRGLKPLSKGINQAIKAMELSASEVSMVGDQIYTDVLGGNLKKLHTIMVKPFELEKNPFFKAKRFFEKIHIKKYYRINEEK